jgi:hypothetical protein
MNPNVQDYKNQRKVVRDHGKMLLITSKYT